MKKLIGHENYRNRHDHLNRLTIHDCGFVFPALHRLRRSAIEDVDRANDLHILHLTVSAYGYIEDHDPLKVELKGNRWIDRSRIFRFYWRFDISADTNGCDWDILLVTALRNRTSVQGSAEQ